MTSMISPWLHASQLATQAQDRLTQASALLRSGDTVRPTNPSPIRVGIPEQNGPDSPDNPWFVSPDKAPAQSRPSRAVMLAGGAVTAIDQALAMEAQLSSGVTTAFRRAKDEALSGLEMLDRDPQLSVAPGRPELQFDAASLWLGLAKNLIELDRGRPTDPPVVIRPPVIRPLPAPGDPGSPITIQPISPVEPPHVQLPAPDAAIQ